MSNPSPEETQLGFRFADRPTHQIIGDIAAYWESKAVGGHLPRQDTIDPVEIPSLLPHVGLIDVEYGQETRFKVRLFGTKLVEAVGEDRTGQYIDEFGAQFEQPIRQSLWGRWQAVLTQCLSEERALFLVGKYSDPERSHLKIHSAALPLTDETGRISRVLGTMVPELREF